MNQLNADWYRENAKPRQIDGHKKSFGHVMVIGGSIGKNGAPILTSKAALRSGCGLVTAYVPENALQALLCFAPEIMSISQQTIEFQGVDLTDLDAIAFGPGLGTDVAAGKMLSRLLSNLYEKALVIDADGLNLLALEPHKLLLLNSRHVLTPHVGEFARLMGDQFDASKIHQQAHEFAQKYGVNLVLKGRNSRIYGYNGLVFENTTGNSGMATAGSGDVLTGIIASLCAQGYETQVAACMGVYLHGLAGDKAIESQSEASLIASDLIENLKLVISY